MFLQRYVFALKSPTILLNIFCAKWINRAMAESEILKKQLFLKNNCIFYGCKEKKQYFCR